MDCIKKAVLTVVLKNDTILLGLQKRGLGKGWWNCFGGKINEYETPLKAASRELQEECGLKARTLVKMGFITLKFINMNYIWHIYIFKTNDFLNTPFETNEMKPAWFFFDSIPYSKMWPDDQYWLPICLKDKKFRGNFIYSNLNTIKEFEISEII